jgi:hypothetical protein
MSHSVSSVFDFFNRRANSVSLTPRAARMRSIFFLSVGTDYPKGDSYEFKRLL